MNITSFCKDKTLLLILMNIYNLGYGEVTFSGHIKNLLSPEVKPFFKTLVKELSVTLVIDNTSNFSQEFLGFPIVLRIKNCNDLKYYLSNIESVARIIYE